MELYSRESAIKARWREEQLALKTHLVLHDDHPDWDLGSEAKLRLVGGVDISFVKKSDVDAALAMLVVMSYPDLRVVHTVSSMVNLKHPYIPGFLAFREVEPIMGLLRNLEEERPELMPQVILVDGNGTLHPNNFGLACHLGVLADIPTVGVGKTMMKIDGLYETWEKKRMRPGSEELLVGQSGRVWGAAIAAKSSSKPVFVSVGHRVSLPTAIELVKSVSKTRVPEPIRAADLSSREVLRRMSNRKERSCEGDRLKD